MKAPKFMEKLIESPFAKKLKGAGGDMPRAKASDGMMVESGSMYKNLLRKVKSSIGLKLDDKTKRKVYRALRKNRKFVESSAGEQGDMFENALSKVAKLRRKGAKIKGGIAGAAAIGGAGYGMMSDSDGDE